MSVEFICDGCGLRAADESGQGSLEIGKPYSWYARRDKETGKWFHACSRECITKTAEKMNMTSIVMPF